MTSQFLSSFHKTALAHKILPSHCLNVFICFKQQKLKKRRQMHSHYFTIFLCQLQSYFSLLSTLKTSKFSCLTRNSSLILLINLYQFATTSLSYGYQLFPSFRATWVYQSRRTLLQCWPIGHLCHGAVTLNFVRRFGQGSYCFTFTRQLFWVQDGEQKHVPMACAPQFVLKTLNRPHMQRVEFIYFS